MDRVQPIESQIQVESFMKDISEPVGKKSKEKREEIILSPIRLCDTPFNESILSSDSPQRHPIPRVIVTMENDPLDHFPVPDFDNLWKVSTFMMNYTGKSSCKILTTSGEVLFKAIYPRSIFCESCQAEITERKVEIVDPQNSDPMMLVKYTTPPYQICYEEETTVVEILEPEGNLMATITQKKTWMNSRISRDVTIVPMSFGKANTYKADFTCNDTSVDFKTTRSGLVVATLIKNLADKDSPTAYSLQILREIKPRDKAILVGFMLARDLLMIDEMQTKTIVDKMTAFFVFIFVVVILMYFVI